MTPFSFSMSSSRNSGLQNHVRQHIEGHGQVLVQNLGVKANQFLTGEGVQTAANGIDRSGDVFGVRFRSL